MKILILIFIFINFAGASSFVDLGNEIYVPSVTDSGFSLIDKKTGDVRFVTIDRNNEINVKESVQTNLLGVTGATAGVLENNKEYLVLASPQSNRLEIITKDDDILRTIFPLEQGPQFPINIKPVTVSNANYPEEILLASKYDNNGETITFYRDLQKNIKGLDKLSGLGSIACLQPFIQSQTKKRLGVGVEAYDEGSRLFLIGYSESNKLIYNQSHNVSNNTQLATNVTREDGETIIIGYLVGEKKLSIIVADELSKLDKPIDIKIDFNIGSIVPIGDDEEPSGILVNSEDGSIAAHYQITKDNKLSPVTSFIPEGGTLMNGMVSVPKKGILMLTKGADSSSSGMQFFRWDGNKWESIKKLDLPKLSNQSTDYPTLFWFSSEPLVSADASLLDFQKVSDWTTGGSGTIDGPTVSNLYRETFLSSVEGLGLPEVFTPQVPSGAASYMTNQYTNTISLSALDSITAFSIPKINISPKSGNFDRPFLINASTDDSALIYYRENEIQSPWKVYKSPILVSYPRNLQFYSQSAFSRSPIISREFNFDINEVKSFDSDGDSVPDFVEQSFGIKPSAGVDSDSDGFTDLDEILQGTSPDNAESKPDISSKPFVGQSFRIAVSPRDYNSIPAIPGEVFTNKPPVFVNLRGMRSELLDRNTVEKVYNPPAISDSRVAILEPNKAVSINEWVILNSPDFFDCLNPDDFDLINKNTGTGREIYRVIQRPVQNPPTIDINLTGSFSDDVTAWIKKAKTTLSHHQYPNSIVTLDPAHSLISVLLETAIYNFLTELDDQIQNDIGVPLDLPADGDNPLQLGRDRFTLFGNRSNDVTRQPLNDKMINALEGAGISFQQLLKTIENVVLEDQKIISFMNDLYEFHASHTSPSAPAANQIPFLSFPIDVIRSLIQKDVIDPDYQSGFSNELVQEFRDRLIRILDEEVNSAKRPIETWTIEVTFAENENLHYRNVENDDPVVFFDGNNKEFSFDRGIGIVEGTRYVITGYTDVDGPNGLNAMEILRADLSFTPTSSDIDKDSDLLDDGWERFFFGSTSIVSAYDVHPINGYSYLQLYLLGNDPRDSAGDIPSQASLIIAPQSTGVQKEEVGNLVIDFNFPEIYFDSFTFTVLESSDLSDPVPVSDANITRVGTNLFRINFISNQFQERSKFFQVSISLRDN